MPYILRSSSIHPAEVSTTNLPLHLSACEPDYKTIITQATLRRRMSRIVKMGVACGLDCLESIASESVGAIITATGLGCLADTEKFMNTLLDNDEQMLNPTPFIQSTFNTIGAQIALIRQIHAYNMTYVHRGLSFESALLDALLRMEEGDRNVLVGAFDELTPVSYAILQRLKAYKGICAGEGAHFFLLGSQPEENDTAPIEIKEVETRARPYHPGEIGQFLQRHRLSAEEVSIFVMGKNGDQEQDAIYGELENSLFSSARCVTFKEECGEYPTASAFALWKTIQLLGETTMTDSGSTSGDAPANAPSNTLTRTALVYNHYQTSHSLILIRQHL